ncbi:190dbec4-574c-4109-816a-0e889b9427cd [Sclerotinia trifoliorum]|uniref:190dbec4-574c-4109-816a-0e889b9427cd n=1 Tax=Sclerotinia trifoliorum TaxID=28548 RepID=A0A8H2VPS7_9HELO|nr:190dbec4-574c-4109-816a-0e889b9427cd [Sclerotinia trifoliorum]
MVSTSTVVHLPNGYHITVNPVFGGFFFKANELNTHTSIFPAGWTVIIQTEDYSDEHPYDSASVATELQSASTERHRHNIQPFRLPTLRNDSLFISSISNPSSNDFKAPISPTRQIAMMLWATLYWYFHQPEPSPHITTAASKNTPDAGKPKADWRIHVRREGVLRGRNLIQKLDRMGLITSEDSTVGLAIDENTPEGWSDMFTSRRAFWQLSARLFLYTFSPNISLASPQGSRPCSPVSGSTSNQSTGNKRDSIESFSGLWSPVSIGPFSSGSHLPTYYPPPPLQYTNTSGTRHPLRPKPPHQGETFYTRYIPSLGQYLSFRVASLSTKPVVYNRPTSSLAPFRHNATNSSLSSIGACLSADLQTAHSSTATQQVIDTAEMTDLQLLNRWMNVPRVDKFWGCSGPIATQEKFLKDNLTSNHSFPVIGLWDGKPFGYFELYWAKEDILGKHVGDNVGDFDRGVHVLVGEDEYRGKHRVQCWITALAHWALVQDYRTNSFVLEPRVDNERFISHLKEAGFVKEREITFPHKQAAFMKLRRECFEAPAL